MDNQKELKIFYWHNMSYKQSEIFFVDGKAEGLGKTFFPYEFLKNLEWFRSFYKNDVREGESSQFTYDYKEIDFMFER
jgi:antitoxin component YwqK of YwqJK toxin-antitoxin module